VHEEMLLISEICEEKKINVPKASAGDSNYWMLTPPMPGSRVVV